MSLSSVFNIAGSGMSAQSTRLNTISSNIANAETVSSSVDQTYRARHPVFATMLQQANGSPNESLFAEQDRVQPVLQVLTHHPTCTHAVVVFQDDHAMVAMIAIKQQEPINDFRTQVSEARMTDDRYDDQRIVACAVIVWDTREVNNRFKGCNEVVAVDRHVVGYHPTRIGVLSERGAMSGILAH